VSSIQDALRKAQRERAARRPVALRAAVDPSVELSPSKRRKRRGLRLGAGVLLVAAAGLAAGLTLGRGLLFTPLQREQASKRVGERVDLGPSVPLKTSPKPMPKRPSLQSSTPQRKPLLSTDSKVSSPPAQAREEKEEGIVRSKASSPIPSPSFSSPQDPMAVIRGLMAQGDMEGAERSLRSLLDQNPGRTDALLALANLYLAERGDLHRAYPLYQKALEQSPRSPEVHVNLGVYYLRSRDLPKARQHIRRALELAPDMAVAHYNLACIEAAEGNLTEARKALQRAVELDPRCAQWALEDPDLGPLREGSQRAGHLKRGPNFQ